jgi:uncharacterized membrane protein YidH (DUF202 family)
MKEEKDYIRDIADIRSMMERSSKFLSLSGWAGIMAGIYALAGAFIAFQFLDFNPGGIDSNSVLPGSVPAGLSGLILLAIAVLILATGTAFFLSYRKAIKKGEKIWNPTTRRLLITMAVPLFTGGLLILVLLIEGLIGLIAPFTLLFYGLALYNAGRFTYDEVKILGFIQIGLGLISSYFVEYGLVIWAFGFGVVHIIYGIYMHYRYEK